MMMNQRNKTATSQKGKEKHLTRNCCDYYNETIKSLKGDAVTHQCHPRRRW
jgi:hypothetical protein